MRPRIAVFTAILGLIDRGYTGNTVRAMIVNKLLCWVAFLWSGNLYLKVRGQSPGLDPTWTPDGWKVMRTSALIAMIVREARSWLPSV
jgi:hypothetical protein